MTAPSVFTARTRIAASAEDVFRFHKMPGAFERLTPPWEHVRVVSKKGGIENDARVELEMQMGAWTGKWVALHYDYVEGKQFRDRQIEGPFRAWDHLHRIEPDGPDACFMEDRIEYELPAGKLGSAIGDSFVRERLARMFAYRHAVLCADVKLHKRFEKRPRIRVAITGASGLLGSALIPLLENGGHQVVKLVREPSKDSDTALWNPQTGEIHPSMGTIDALIHFAGENIGDGRWTEARKRVIRESRVDTTQRLSEVLSRRDDIKTFVGVSAVGFYGDPGEQAVDETSPQGKGFLAEVCGAWEEASSLLAQGGVRVVHPRFAPVLSPQGGPLKKMLPAFRSGAGGPIGSGKQFFSWVSIDDAISVLYHLLLDEKIQGAVNVVAPGVLRNAEFTHALGHVLKRPTVLPVPATAIRLLFGEMGDELLLHGAKVIPERLRRAEYEFRYPEIDGALRHLLGKEAEPS